MTTQWPTAPPVVQAAVGILSAGLPSILVSPIMPLVRPATFIRVDRVGGGQLNLATELARLLVECWVAETAGGYGGAEILANNARHALYASAGQVFAGIFIRAWRNEDGPVNYPDPDVSNMTRFQFTGDLLVSNH
jgi:hypothetical protein